MLTVAGLAVGTTLLAGCRDTTAPDESIRNASRLSALTPKSAARSYLSFSQAVGRAAVLIQNAWTQGCLDIPNGNAVAYQWVQQYPCHGGINQQFVVFQVGADPSVVTIVAKANRGIL